VCLSIKDKVELLTRVDEGASVKLHVSYKYLFLILLYLFLCFCTFQAWLPKLLKNPLSGNPQVPSVPDKWSYCISMLAKICRFPMKIQMTGLRLVIGNVCDIRSLFNRLLKIGTHFCAFWRLHIKTPRTKTVSLR
jgi:hypothetical protein